MNRISQHARSTLRRLGAAAAMAAGVLLLQPAAADPIFKCGKTYTNVPSGEGPAQLKSRGCVLVDPDRPQAAKTADIAIDGSRQITVPIGQDGRFWIRGSVNGFPVQFVIDKASTVQAGVAVTEAFAARANLIGGAPAHVQTSGGIMEGRRVEGIPMTFGPFRVRQATVVVGSLGGKSPEALLGQELLSMFEVTANEREMTIVSKTEAARQPLLPVDTSKSRR
ncbi:retropepsin-like aspartic protease [Variovorax sp. J22P271]|uniref:retropepsin-like aspartic protease family protein n=1 Tax=Variovorax davisae TaxID=3053515 RepID=UPI0025791CBE|nr:retropepsin-like aspartic protease [Variovorax sp. J22P271]MDM0035230.1 retropepsin-like aspartic protease [Variovorax sp. J22P271]